MLRCSKKRLGQGKSEVGLEVLRASMQYSGVLGQAEDKVMLI